MTERLTEGQIFDFDPRESGSIIQFGISQSEKGSAKFTLLQILGIVSVPILLGTGLGYLAGVNLSEVPIDRWVEVVNNLTQIRKLFPDAAMGIVGGYTFAGAATGGALTAGYCLYKLYRETD